MALTSAVKTNVLWNLKSRQYEVESTTNPARWGQCHNYSNHLSFGRNNNDNVELFLWGDCFN